MLRSIIAAIVLGVTGWLIGRYFGKPPTLAPAKRVIPIVEVNSAPENSDNQQIHRANIKPDELLDAVKALPKEANELTQLSALFALCERFESPEFKAALEAMGGMERKWRVRLLEIWAERDTASAVGWFQALDANERAKVFPEWAQTWAKLDSSSLRQWLATRTEGEREQLNRIDDRVFDKSGFVRSMAEVDPAAAFELTKLYPKLIDSATILRVWAQREPDSAAAKALTLKASERATAVDFVMREWGAKDPESALAWIDALTDPVLAERARGGFVRSVAPGDPAAAMRFVRDRFPLNEQGGTWRFVAAYASMKDPESAVTVALAEGDVNARRALLAEAIRFMTSKDAGVKGGLWPPADTDAVTDPKRAADLWLAESSSSKQPLPHLDEVTAALAKREGIASAIAFLDRLPPELNADVKDIPDWLGQVKSWNEVAEAAANMEAGPRRTAWMEKAVAALAKDGDLQTAQSLTERLPEGVERSGAIRAMAGACFPGNAAAGAELLLTLPDGRAELQAGLAGWLERDARKAGSWIRATDLLNEEEKAQIMQSVAAKTEGSRP